MELRSSCLLIQDGTIGLSCCNSDNGDYAYFSWPIPTTFELINEDNSVIKAHDFKFSLIFEDERVWGLGFITLVTSFFPV